MHNPEVIKFPAPECRLRHGCYHWEGDKDQSWRWLVDKHPFNTKVSLLMPDSPIVPKALQELLTGDTQFYRVDNLPLHELCAPAFIQAFLNKGEAFGLSCDTRLDLDNTAVLTPDGTLKILVDKLTYQQLSLSGRLSAHILRRPLDRFVVEVNLKSPDFHPNKAYYHRVINAFTNLPLTFSFWIMWLPHDSEVCPSSIAKYFHDLGYSVSECGASMSNEVREEAIMPFPEEEEEEETKEEDKIAEPEDLLEWIGCQTLGIKLNNEESVLSSVVKPKHGTPVLNLSCVQCSGLFPPSHIHTLIEHIREWLTQRDEKAVPWVSLTVFGHPDSLISWEQQEHSYHANGDNMYTLVITRRSLVAYQLQGPAKPQRLYVKTNKNK